MNAIVSTVMIGVGATALLDLWTIARTHLFRVSAPDYGHVGRWLAHMLHGRFRHDRIAATPPGQGERAIGWVAHYVIGVGFAAVLIAAWGDQWVREPTLGPALIVGVVSVAAPFLVMQPALGAGIAARRTPRPNAARIQSLITHTVFGLGLYGAARVLNLFWPQ